MLQTEDLFLSATACLIKGQHKAQSTGEIYLSNKPWYFLPQASCGPDRALKNSNPSVWSVPPAQPRYSPSPHGLVHTIGMTPAVREVCWLISACQLMRSHSLGSLAQTTALRVTWITLSVTCYDGNPVKHFGKHECALCECYSHQICCGSPWLTRALRF